jgi:hypothetical protein
MGRRLGILEYKWLHGMPADFWVLYAKNVQRFIEANKLRPVSKEVLGLGLGKTQAMEKISMHYPWWYFGGMKAAHLHYKGELYVLNKKQWSDFSNQIIKEFSEKLAGAKTVNFEQLIELSETVNGII